VDATLDRFGRIDVLVNNGVYQGAVQTQEFLDTDAEQFALMMQAGAGADPWEELSAIAIPVLLISGAEEDPEGVQDEMAARLSSGRSVHLPGCGHVGAFLRPDEVCAAALPVLRELSGRTRP